MAELEEMGFLMHPHTSAGRVPTEKGYRYYIDSLISFDRDTQGITEQLDQTSSLQSGDLHHIMEEASQFLAKLSRHTGVVVAPAEPEVRSSTLNSSGSAAISVDHFRDEHRDGAEQACRAR